MERAFGKILALGAVLAIAGAMSGAPLARAGFLAGECHLLPIKYVEIEDGGRRGPYVTVGGFRPTAHEEVAFNHRRVSGGTWVTEVVGCTENALALPIPTPYYISVPVSTFRGARTLEIIGANRRVRQRLP